MNALTPKGPLLQLEDLSVRFAGALYPALTQVTLTLAAGRLVLVGESGAGKSTFLKVLAGLVRPSQGTVCVLGVRPFESSKAMMALRRRLGVVMQEPRASLPPNRSVLDSVAEPLVVLGGIRWANARARASELLAELGIPMERHGALPSRLSGGENQRISIARAVCRPVGLLLADEATANLDPVQGNEITRLVGRLAQGPAAANGSASGSDAEKPGLVWVTHRLDEAQILGGVVMVLLGGHVVEVFDSFESWEAAKHPYTRLLRDPYACSQPQVESAALPDSCPFAGRCPHGKPCAQLPVPPLVSVAQGHQVACWNVRISKKE